MRNMQNPPEYPYGARRIYINGPWTYVACVGAVNDWTVYKGPTEWGEDRIARNGDKIDQKIAELLFPEFVKAGLVWRS